MALSSWIGRSQVHDGSRPQRRRRSQRKLILPGQGGLPRTRSRLSLLTAILEGNLNGPVQTPDCTDPIRGG